MQLPTKTIQIPLISCQNRTTFLYNVKQYVFTLAIKNEDIFIKQGLKNQYIHESIQQQQIRTAYNTGKAKEAKISQYPIYVHSYIKKGVFSLNAFGLKGIECLDIWLPLLKKHPEINKDKLSITSTEKTVTIKKADVNQTYQSNNWIPYRNCKLHKGFYYNMDKKPNKLANFEERLKKNIETFLKETCEIANFDLKELWLSIKKIEILGRKIALNKQEKEFFKIEFECNYNLPSIFSLGQNVAYGNGVFEKK